MGENPFPIISARQGWEFPDDRFYSLAIFYRDVGRVFPPDRGAIPRTQKKPPPFVRETCFSRFFKNLSALKQKNTNFSVFIIQKLDGLEGDVEGQGVAHPGVDFAVTGMGQGKQKGGAGIHFQADVAVFL